MTDTNPLLRYTRKEKIYIKLPSDGNYPAGVVDMSTNNELGVQAMTAADQIALRNPDGLLNGQAIANVIKSCCPGVKKPEKMIASDINAILLGIRHATN